MRAPLDSNCGRRTDPLSAVPVSPPARPLRPTSCDHHSRPTGHIINSYTRSTLVSTNLCVCVRNEPQCTYNCCFRRVPARVETTVVWLHFGRTLFSSSAALTCSTFIFTFTYTCKSIHRHPSWQIRQRRLFYTLNLLLFIVRTDPPVNFGPERKCNTRATNKGVTFQTNGCSCDQSISNFTPIIICGFRVRTPRYRLIKRSVNTNCQLCTTHNK
jgi:hypothetical protein